MEQMDRPAKRPAAGQASKPVLGPAVAETSTNVHAQGEQPSPGATPAPAEISFCPDCFYDLRGSQGDACPECGQVLDLEQLRRGLIPWAQRCEVGRLQGLCRTAWQATFRPRQLCYAVAQPVSYRDARWFQVLSVLWAVIGVATVYAATFAAVVWTTDTWIEWPMVVIPAVVLPLSIPLLLAVTGVHTYWLHPRHLAVEQQNRAIALGYYAASPLAFLPFAALLAGGAWAGAFIAGELYPGQAEELLTIFVLVCWGPLLTIPVAMLRVMLVMARYAARREALGLTIMWVSLPVLWLALTGLILGLIPALIGYVWLMIYTLLA